MPVSSGPLGLCGRVEESSVEEDLLARRPIKTTRPSPAAAPELGRLARNAESRPVTPDAESKSSKAPREVELFTPQLRPPMALLTILDDNRRSGETIRLRDSVVTIGRTQGTVTIPHDLLISGEHLKIERVEERDGYCWYLFDLESTNGTFIRKRRFSLHDSFELLLGGFRFRFRIPDSEMNPPASEMDDSQSGIETRGWAAISRVALQQLTGPQLVQCDGDDEVNVFNLSQDSIIGSDPAQAQICIEDPFLSPAHAKIYQEGGRWKVEDLDSRNGVWLRMERCRTARGCEFILGEQRFLLKTD